MTVGVLGGLHGDFPPVLSHLDPLDDVFAKLDADRDFVPAFVQLGKLGSGNQMYVPWMQATYIMAANREALQYLPEGADLNSLTYGQLAAWGRRSGRRRASASSAFPPAPRA